MSRKLETDYLVIGSGAVGMAFVDTLLSETDAQVVMVDRYAKPGGHWNVAYPFVTLHQPSQFYGVSSLELSKGEKDTIGLNKGLYGLATGAEVSAYFDEVMRKRFLSSGRVQYFPLCDYKGEGKFESLLTGEVYTVSGYKKLVDCTHLYTRVPATHTPSFTMAHDVTFLPINGLVTLQSPPSGYVIIGGGKTGIDACLWLLEQGVDSDKITWIVSRDAWLINRNKVQPTEEFFEDTIGGQADQMEAIANATSLHDLYDRLEAAEVMVRLDPAVRPTMFHGATISELELEELRRIKNVVRLGKVQRIEADQIILDRGTLPTSVDHVHVDCSARAINNLDPKTIFKDGVITPQTVRPYQPVFSASVIAYVEAHYPDDKTKNKLCQVVPLPNHDTDWVPMMAMQMVNQFTWSQDKPLRTWIRNNRLDGFGKLIRNIDRNDEGKMAILKRMRDHAMPAMAKLQQFMVERESQQSTDMTHPQLEVQKKVFLQSRLVEVPQDRLKIDEGEILLSIEKFAYTANNITYAVAGDMLGYWQFFPPAGEEADAWGVIPVWGFARVVESHVPEIAVGERLYGYFPPAHQVKMKPVKIADERFIDGAAHRAQLPAGYNLYQRLAHEPGYDPQWDRERMLLWPLHITAYCIWDAMQEADWFGAQQVLILSASSKTSTGVGYALKRDAEAPSTIGITSERNKETVEATGIYDHCLTYDQIKEVDPQVPTAIVDMAGNAKVLAALHTHLGDQMRWTFKVGITHWAQAQERPGIISERSKFFFAPSHLQKRMKEWGIAEFNRRSSAFLRESATQTKEWLEFKEVQGLQELAKLHPSVCEGGRPANEGLIVVMG